MKPQITALYYCDFCGETFTKTMPEDENPFGEVPVCPYCESGYIPDCIGYFHNSDIKTEEEGDDKRGV